MTDEEKITEEWERQKRPPVTVSRGLQPRPVTLDEQRDAERQAFPFVAIGDPICFDLVTGQGLAGTLHDHGSDFRGRLDWVAIEIGEEGPLVILADKIVMFRRGTPKQRPAQPVQVPVPPNFLDGLRGHG